VRKYWQKAALAAAIIGGCLGISSSAAVAAPTPPTPAVAPSPTSGPHWHPAHAQPAPINVRITSPARGCVILYKPGADIAAKATGINSIRRGQVVTNVTFTAVNPGGDIKTSHTGYKVNSDEYHANLHLNGANTPGNWTLVTTINYAGTDSSSTRYADTYFCVQRNTFSGNIRSSNDHPAREQRYNLSGGVYGLAANAKTYPGMSHARVHIAFVPLHAGPVQYLGWATAGSNGVWNMTTLGTGRAGHVYVIYAGNGSYAPFVSDGHLEGASVG
jgi:hypothetical protein